MTLHTHYWRCLFATGTREKVEFSVQDYQQFDFSAVGGLTTFQALQMVNRWNREACLRATPLWLYYLEPA